MTFEQLIMEKKPELKHPAMVTGFAGWPNAAGVSSEVVNHLREIVGAQKIGSINPEEFYTFTSVAPIITRPVTLVRGGVVDDMTFPPNEIFACSSGDKGSDLLLISGIEPDLKWQTYADIIFKLASDFGVRRLYTVGGYYDNLPHTREPRVSAAVNDSVLKKKLEAFDVAFTDYQGPTSIQTFLLLESRKYDIESISLWGAVPYYIKTNYPKAYHKVLEILSHLLELELDIVYLKEAAKKMDAELESKIREDPKLSEYVKELERAYDLSQSPPERVNTDDIVTDIQEFLKRQRDDEVEEDEDNDE